MEFLYAVLPVPHIKPISSRGTLCAGLPAPHITLDNDMIYLDMSIKGEMKNEYSM